MNTLTLPQLLNASWRCHASFCKGRKFFLPEDKTPWTFNQIVHLFYQKVQVDSTQAKDAYSKLIVLHKLGEKALSKAPLQTRIFTLFKRLFNSSLRKKELGELKKWGGRLEWTYTKNRELNRKINQVQYFIHDHQSLVRKTLTSIGFTEVVNNQISLSSKGYNPMDPPTDAPKGRRWQFLVNYANFHGALMISKGKFHAFVVRFPSIEIELHLSNEQFFKKILENLHLIKQWAPHVNSLYTWETEGGFFWAHRPISKSSSKVN